MDKAALLLPTRPKHDSPTLPQDTNHIVLPRPLISNGKTSITAPSESSFVSQFGAHLPPAQYIPSDYGTTAFYDFPPSISDAKSPVQNILFIHGAGTPALGLIPLARAVQAANPHAHLVLYDLWGHGLSSTPLVPHVPGLFHAQIFILLAKLGWAKAHIIGYSFGGSTAASFVALHPQHAESVTILAPAGLLKLSNLTDEQQRLTAGREGVGEQAAEDFILDFINGGPLVLAADWKARFARGEISGGPIQAWSREHHPGHRATIVGMFRDGGILDKHTAFATAASHSEVRNLAILGELDDLSRVEDLSPLGWTDIVVVKGAGHSLVREQVAEVAGPINRLLKDLN